MRITADNLKIVMYPAPVLRKKSAAVAEVNEEVRRVGERMLELMHEARGVGLAAPQVGLSWRMFVANATDDPAKDRVYVNPVLSKPSGETELFEEGCLSIPNVTGQIMRPKGITITATGLDGEVFTETSEELIARVWQHETDHLDGILILDRMTQTDKLANRRAVKGLEEDYKGGR